jgi:hypothetical protein
MRYASDAYHKFTGSKLYTRATQSAGYMLPVKQNTTYKIYVGDCTAGVSAIGYDQLYNNPSMTDYVSITSLSKGVVGTYNTGTKTKWLFICVYNSGAEYDRYLDVDTVQIEEAAATPYVPPRQDSITIPASAELHGFGGTWDSIEDGYYNKRFNRETKTTDSSGNFVLSGYASGTVIVRNKSTGEVKVLTAAASVSTGWNMTEVEILYKLAVPLRTRLLRSINLYAGQNNILSPDSKLPLAMSLEYTDKGAEETRGFARNFREVSRTEHHEHKPMFLETSKFYKMAEEYELSWDDIFFDTDLDVAQMEKKEFFVEVLKGEDDTILYSGCFIEGLNESEDDVRKQAVSIVCQERIL